MKQVSTMSPTGCSKNFKMNSVMLVGLGNIGIGYDIHDGGFMCGQTMTHAKALLESGDFELTDFTDHSVERLATARKIIQSTKMYKVKSYTDLEKPDLVVIAVSTSQHASVVRSLSNPPKILILEKPAGSDSIECSKISSWAEENGVQIFVNYFRRYLSSSVNARFYFNLLQAGRFLSAEIDAYGTLLNIHSHFIDLGLFLTNQRIFCDCANKLISQTKDGVVASCGFCKVFFHLRGVGGLKKSMSMSLKFENVEILVRDDGKSISIMDKITNVATMFECELSEYKNYQKIVYEKIGSMIKLGKTEECYLGLVNANLVHQFLESVEVNNAE